MIPPTSPRPAVIPAYKGAARTPLQWNAVLQGCGLTRETCVRWSPIFAAVIQPETFSAGDTDLADFLPEVIHETSGLTRLEENLNYSVQGLLVTFGRHRISETQARIYGRDVGRVANQQAIANIIYGGTFGREKLGNVAPGDGWLFRGRGLIQVTGRANYKRLGPMLGVDLLAQPELLAQPMLALRSAVLWWEDRIPDSMLGETTSIRARVNGGDLGLEKVLKLTTLAKAAVRQSLA